MADEAILRIVIDDSGATAPTVVPAAPTPPTSTPAPIPAPPQPKAAPTPAGPAPRPTPPPHPVPPPTSPVQLQTAPPIPPKAVTTQPPVDPSLFGHSYTATAKNLLRPIQYLDDHRKEREFLNKLLSHQDLQSGGLQTELRRLGEEKLAMYSSLRKALGRPDATDAAPVVPATIPVPKTGVPPPPQLPPVPIPERIQSKTDPHEDRRRLNEERARKRAYPPIAPVPAPEEEFKTPDWLAKADIPKAKAEVPEKKGKLEPTPKPIPPPAPTKSEPVPVDVVKPPKPEPPPAAPPQVQTAPPEPTESVLSTNDIEEERRLRQERIAARRRGEQVETPAHGVGEIPLPAQVPIPAPTPAPDMVADVDEERRRRQERIAARRRGEEATVPPLSELPTRPLTISPPIPPKSETPAPPAHQVQTTPPAPPKSEPIPVELVKPPEPKPPPAAPPPVPKKPTPFLQSDVAVGEESEVGPSTYTGLPGSAKYKRKKAEAEGTLPPPEVEPPFDPVPAFDPQGEARKRREGERRKAQVDEAYKEQYGDRDKKKPMDAVLDVVDSLRGTIGGLFGTLAGAAVDVVQGFRKASAEKEKEDYTKQLLSEVPTAATTPLQPPQVQQPPIQPPPQALPIEPSVPAVPVAPNVPPTPNAPVAQIPLVAKTVSTVESASTAKQAPDQTQASKAADSIVNMSGTARATKEISSLAGVSEEASKKLALLGVGAVAAVVAFGAITGALDAAVQRYGEVSPQVAQAQAMVEVRQVMNDVRRGQEHGAELARYVEAQGRMQEKFEEAKMKFLTRIAPTIEAVFDVMGTVADAVGVLQDGISGMVEVVNKIAETVNGVLTVRIFKFSEDEDPIDPTEGVLFKGDPGADLPEV